MQRVFHKDKKFTFISLAFLIKLIPKQKYKCHENKIRSNMIWNVKKYWDVMYCIDLAIAASFFLLLSKFFFTWSKDMLQ